MRNRASADGLRAAQAAVDEGLLKATKSEVPFITEAARELTRTAGQRLRPLPALPAARSGDPGAPGVVPAAAVVELTHLANALPRRRTGRGDRTARRPVPGRPLGQHGGGDRDPVEHHLEVLASRTGSLAARAVLSTLPDCPARTALESLRETVTRRADAAPPPGPGTSTAPSSCG
ncbi:hypothetical protein [Streptomyces sp. 6N106]|uniref:hypothetical protein n=1 Tax=Streptomyces sp. 6N106 TaxID=3457418 RepID=UPI003FD53062